MSDDVYRERARLVALVASLYPSVRSYSDPDEPKWSVVYVDSPAGQLSWHIAENDVDLFTHVPLVAPDDPRAQWDNHTTEQKYDRVAELVAKWLPARMIHIHLHAEGVAFDEQALRDLIQREIRRHAAGRAT